MSDIKQAAKWMQEGKRVRRPGYAEQFAMYLPEGIHGDVRFGYQGKKPEPYFFQLEELLADDWEIAE